MTGFPYEPGEALVTFVDVLRWRALQQPEQRTFTFLAEGETEEAQLTAAELDRRARAIGALLQRCGAIRERVLLLFPPGLDFIAAFFGCLYGAAVAVPAYPPEPARLSRTLPRLRSVVADSRPSVVLTTSAVLALAEHLFDEAPELRALRWVATDDVPASLAADWLDPAVDGDTLAFLQYTSGSTAAPKGVMVSHRNLLTNQHAIRLIFQNTRDCICVSWLPTYHDMGLIGQVLHPLYVGGRSVLMSPLAFLQHPVRWLRAISRYRATLCTAPNFAFDLCVRKVSAEQKGGLDLSSWSRAINGAEPVRAETLERFATAFEPCGFRREAFYPVYGLAEATLLVSGGPLGTVTLPATVSASALERHEVVAVPDDGRGVRRMVACGQPAPGHRVEVVDPDSLVRCRPDQVGEIWVSGGSVAQGYWNRPLETAQTFGARLADTHEGPFLRTGDLGVLRDGRLFVTGRLKDLIIVRGRNHYPQDIERTVERVHAALRAGCGAAFSLEVDGAERLVVAQEIERHARDVNMGELTAAIRQAVAEEHDLQVDAIVLLKAGGLPKTSSGKIQRRACRDLILAGSADVVGEWRLSVLRAA